MLYESGWGYPAQCHCKERKDIKSPLFPLFPLFSLHPCPEERPCENRGETAVQKSETKLVLFKSLSLWDWLCSLGRLQTALQSEQAFPKQSQEGTAHPWLCSFLCPDPPGSCAAVEMHQFACRDHQGQSTHELLIFYPAMIAPVLFANTQTFRVWLLAVQHALLSVWCSDSSSKRSSPSPARFEGGGTIASEARGEEVQPYGQCLQKQNETKQNKKAGIKRKYMLVKIELH